jgi:hypothetical protein
MKSTRRRRGSFEKAANIGLIIAALPMIAFQIYWKWHDTAHRSTKTRDDKFLQFTPYLRPILTLFITSCLGVIGIIILSSPAPGQIDFAGDCRGVFLPFPATFRLSQIESIHLRSFTLQLTDIASGKIIRNGDVALLTPPATVSLVPLNQTDYAPPVILGRLVGKQGQGALETKGSTQLTVDGCTSRSSACFSVTGTRETQIQGVIQTDQLDVTANRVGVETQTPALTSHDDRTVDLSAVNTLAFVRAHFTTMVDALPDSKSIATITSLTPTAQALKVALSAPPRTDTAEIDFTSCSNVQMVYKERKLETAVNDRPTDVALTVKDLTINRLDAKPPSGGEVSSVFTLSVSARAQSLKQAGRELLPTALDRILDGSTRDKGLLGFVILFFVFAGGIFTKHALESLAKLLVTPKSKEEE